MKTTFSQIAAIVLTVGSIVLFIAGFYSSLDIFTSYTGAYVTILLVGLVCSIFAYRDAKRLNGSKWLYGIFLAINLLLLLGMLLVLYMLWGAGK